MNDPTIALQSLISLGMLFALGLLFERTCREMQIENEEFAGFEQLLEWRKANPTLGIGDSEYARKLVMRRIGAYDRFALCYALPPKERIAHLAWLYALLDDHAGPPHQHRLGFEEEQ
jgi:hypothetical protein